MAIQSIEFIKVRAVKETNIPYKCDSSTKVAEIVNNMFDLNNRTEEVFGMLAVDNKNRVTGGHILFMGELSQCNVSPKEIIKHALANNARSIILFHNHPAGDPYPSYSDRTVTKKIVAAAAVLDITVLDHVIIGDSYYSFAEKSEVPRIDTVHMHEDIMRVIDDYTNRGTV
jgi:DNA repair protein RadC